MENLKKVLKDLIFDNANSSEKIKIATEALQSLVCSKMSIHEAPIVSVSKVRTADNEYVYDIGMRNEKKPWYFGNNILIHNSCYFSAMPVLKKEIDENKLKWGRDEAVSLYDQVADITNESFVEFMEKSFHCPPSRGEVIKAGREVVGERGLFITKKRYALSYYDKDGKRVDKDEPGASKLKVMGLDLRRSDTPVFIQQFLMDLLIMVLDGLDEQTILDAITAFRAEFRNRPGWEKGSPKRANNIAKYRAKDAVGKVSVPGHVRASLNWNSLRDMYSDKYSMSITDGAKVVVCKLRSNPLGFTSVAYPVDEMRLPQWFKDLPFDHDAMEIAIVDNKLDNLLGVLKWDLSSTEERNVFNNLFDF